MRLQVGEVTSVDPAQGTARVKIEEQDGKVSAPLSILRRGNDDWMPQIDESVLCAFTKQSEGFILGAFNSEGSLPTLTSGESSSSE